MSRTVSILFIAGFCSCLFSVGIVQAVWELREGESIQMLDIVEDTFAQPKKRNEAIAGLFVDLRLKLDSLAAQLRKTREAQEGEFDWYDAEMVAEEALFVVEDIRKNAIAINRHIAADTLSEAVTRIDSLHAAIEEVYVACQDEDGASAEKLLASVQGRAKRLALRYPKPGFADVPRLAWDAFWRHTAFSQRYLRSWEAEMEETSVAANTLRPPMQFLRYALLHDLGEKGVRGRQGWYFYKPGIEYLTRPYIRDPRSIVVDPNDKPLVDNPLACITNFKRQLDTLGVEVLVVIVPGKGSVYPDMLNGEVDPDEACLSSHSLRTIAELRDSGVAVVDLFKPFHDERQRDSTAGDSLYLRKDTHWRSRGLRLCAGLVAERIREYPWYDPAGETVEYILDTVTVDRVGDVGSMIGLPDFNMRELRLSFEVESTKCFQVYRVRRDESGEETGRSLYRDDFQRSNVLVLGDSFSRIYQTDAPRGAGWIAHLAFELGQPVASIVSDGGASTLVREKLARSAEVLHGKKLVVWEFVERDLRFGAKGWQDISLNLE